MSTPILTRDEIEAKIVLLTNEIRQWRKTGSPGDAEYAEAVRDDLLEQLWTLVHS